MTVTAPIILGFDTSSPVCRAALIEGGRLLAHREEEMVRGQAERLLGMCQDLLAENALDTADLTALGVGIGPGNFTGIRISVAAARGLALGLGIPAIGVSSFEALRFGVTGPCGCAVAARREQIFLQCFDAAGAPQDPVQCPTDDLPEFDGPLVGHDGIPPRAPLAVAICHIAHATLGTDVPRPAPLYLRPADAAPARDPPPKILA